MAVGSPKARLMPGVNHMVVSIFVRENQKAILSRWVVEASRLGSARGIPEAELLEAMPEILRCLADDCEMRTAILDVHLAGRLHRGFLLRDVVREFVLLGRALQASAAATEPARRPSDDQMAAMLERVGACIDHALRMFADEAGEVERERTFSRQLDSLVQFDEERPLVDLEHVPELACETLAATGAVLYVFEPATSTLVLRAGQGMGTSGDRVRLDSFELVARAARSPGILQSVVEGKQDGLLAAVRLEHQDELLGVICVAMSGPSLSRNDCLLLELLAERVGVLLEVSLRFDHLAERNVALAAERQAHGRFLALVAHDLRGPLFIAKLATQKLGRLLTTPGPVTLLLETLHRSIDRIDRMVLDLLDADRVRSGALLPLELSRFDLSALLREVVNRDLVFAHGDLFDLQLPEVPVMGRWSAAELSRSIWNLAANAVKYGKRGGRVQLRVVDEGSSVVLSVHNDGVPIPNTMLERIFVPFSRLDERGTGWGLGLALVRACAVAHGGSIEVSSDPLAGTVFTLRLPREAATAAQAQPALATEERQQHG